MGSGMRKLWNRVMGPRRHWLCRGVKESAWRMLFDSEQFRHRGGSAGTMPIPAQHPPSEGFAKNCITAATLVELFYQTHRKKRRVERKRMTTATLLSCNSI